MCLSSGRPTRGKHDAWAGEWFRDMVARTACPFGAGARKLLVVALVAGVAFWVVRRGARAADEANYVIKFACVAPEGSVYVQEARKWDQELRRRTGGRATLRIFAGGILGEEEDIIRKMRAGQVHATGVTGIGMGEMVPSSRVLELPRLFRSFEELEAVTVRLTPYFEKAFWEKGYVLMGFTYVGPIHIFSKKPVHNLEELRRTRVWAWDADPISLALLDVFHAPSVPMSLLNVLPSLQTGVIDGVYGSPLAIVTMQWFRYVDYITAVPLGFASGVIVMDRRAFEKLPPDIQALQRELGKKYTQRITRRVREDNARALALMRQRGLEEVTPSPEDMAELDRLAPQVWNRFVGTLYSRELLEDVQRAVAEIRDEGAT